MNWINAELDKVPHLDGLEVENKIALQLMDLASSIMRKHPSIQVVYWSGVKHVEAANSIPEYDQDEFMLLFNPAEASATRV
jgi:hypothetical protein